jgi:hypothetical protein
MQPYYRSAAQIVGTMHFRFICAVIANVFVGLGRSHQQRELIRCRIDGKLFNQILDSTMHDMDVLFATVSKEMSEAVVEVWAALRKDIESGKEKKYLRSRADMNGFLGLLNRLKERHEQIVKDISQIQ